MKHYRQIPKKEEDITNKVRSWERSEPRPEPFVGQARLYIYRKELFGFEDSGLNRSEVQPVPLPISQILRKNVLIHEGFLNKWSVFWQKYPLPGNPVFQKLVISNKIYTGIPSCSIRCDRGVRLAGGRCILVFMIFIAAPHTGQTTVPLSEMPCGAPVEQCFDIGWRSGFWIVL